MFILSQNKEKLYNLSGHIEGIGYEETKEYAKGKKEDKIRHTLMVYDGCCEEVAEYETKPPDEHCENIAACAGCQNPA